MDDLTHKNDPNKDSSDLVINELSTPSVSAEDEHQTAVAGDSLEDAVNQGAVDTATQVDFLVKSLIAEQGDIREKLKEQRAMLKDVLESDVNYRDIDNQMKELAKRKKQVAQTLAESASAKQAKEETQNLRNDLKVIEKKLMGYLQQYLDTYNSRTIEDRDGQLREIVTLYKLVKKAV